MPAFGLDTGKVYSAYFYSTNSRRSGETVPGMCDLQLSRPGFR